ncbi:hypothetical protein HMPREF1866_01827 [Lachnoanaerobaculum saburreum]|uniref:Uncharacterized protein n=1 Tax=Lachnoanaerobaculum saburreum TaxID=467210 RepID=A0A133ZMJ2_9FIRM|nr:hypothetical protein HMPREF1866_01827 [Lachnoanaerobaculum saburreum]
MDTLYFSFSILSPPLKLLSYNNVFLSVYHFKMLYKFVNM